jgi:transposase
MRSHTTIAQREATLDRWVNSGLSLSQFAKQEHIPISTLYAWKNKHLKNRVVVTKKSNPDRWSAQEKFSAVIETLTLPEVELSAYCRKKGLFPEQVKRWKEACIQGNVQSSSASGSSASSKEDKKKIKQLERELNRKEKALAETAALLVLRKKFNALWEENEEN